MAASKSVTFYWRGN